MKVLWLNPVEKELVRVAYRNYEWYNNRSGNYQSWMYTRGDHAEWMNQHDRVELNRRMECLDTHLVAEVFKCTLSEFPGPVRPAWTKYLHKTLQIKPPANEVVNQTLSLVLNASSSRKPEEG